MTFLVLIAVILFGLYFLLTWLAQLDPPTLTRLVKVTFIVVLVVAIALLVLSGRGFHGLALSVLILPFFFRWSWIRKKETEPQNNDAQGKASSSKTRPKSYEQPMTEEQAREVLGVTGPLTREKIMKGYKAMMTRVHPDHGGSTYLAQQINEAKDVLLRGL